MNTEAGILCLDSRVTALCDFRKELWETGFYKLLAVFHNLIVEQLIILCEICKLCGMFGS